MNTLRLTAFAVLVVLAAAPARAQFQPTSGAPGFEVATGLVQLTTDLNASSGAVTDARINLLTFAGLDEDATRLRAALAAALLIEDPAERAADLSEVQKSTAAVGVTNASQLAGIGTVEAGKQQLIIPMFTNLLIASLRTTGAVQAAQALAQQIPQAMAEATSQARGNPLRARQITANARFATEFGREQLPLMLADAQALATDLPFVLDTMRRIAAANNVALPEVSTVTATTRFLP